MTRQSPDLTSEQVAQLADATTMQEWVAVARSLVASGVTVAAISRATGVRPGTVHGRLKPRPPAPTGQVLPRQATILGEENGLIPCRECGRWFRSLSGHLTRRHGMSCDDYREVWGIPAGVPLTTIETRENTVAAGSRRYAESEEAREAMARGRRSAGSAARVQGQSTAVGHERAEARLRADLEANGWASLAEAVRWARGEGVGWSVLARRLGGRSISPLRERAESEGLTLPRPRGAKTQARVDRIRAWHSAHGSLDGLPRDLARFLTYHRHHVQASGESWVSVDLDSIDPSWRRPV